MDNFIDYAFEAWPGFVVRTGLLKCCATGYERAPSFCVSQESKDKHLVIYVMYGEIDIEQEGKRFYAVSGQCVLLTLRKAHRFYTNQEQTAHIFWLLFEGELLDGLMIKYAESGDLPYVFSSDMAVENICRCFEIYRKCGPDCQENLSPVIYRMVLGILKDKMFSRQFQLITLEEKLKREIDRYIDVHISRKITLDELAACANMSKFHFSRQFKELWGLSPMAYVQSRKISLSKILLKLTDYKESVIADMLGFTDYSHFSKAFKKLNAISPGQYRKLTAKQSAPW